MPLPNSRLLRHFTLLVALAAAHARSGDADAAAAAAFVSAAEQRLQALNFESARADWIAQNFSIPDTESLSAERSSELNQAYAAYALEAKRFAGAELPEELRRKLMRLRLGASPPPPADAALARELSRRVAAMDARYGRGRYCEGGDCLALNQLENIIGNQVLDAAGTRVEQSPQRRLEVWRGWHDAVGVPMRADFRRVVELSNQGARELGFADTGAMWRSGYDMPPERFAREVDRLLEQVRPLYQSLHCYVRGRLNRKYGDAVVPRTGAMPAHMLGNIWAQEWNNVYDDIRQPDWNVADWTPALRKKYGAGTDLRRGRPADWRQSAEGRMMQTGEAFFTSLGFAPLPQSFWERSNFVLPLDHDMVCHASAWDVDDADDLRIKMCTQINATDFVTVHHELGHNIYQRAYKAQPYLFRYSANDGFHEALGDTIALAITPHYLKQIGLIDSEPDAAQDIALLMQRALSRVALLPFTAMIDRWRWGVFDGSITPDRYNAAWWELRERYQGIRPALARDETRFDPGAKYHVAGNVPYMRYFLAEVLQFQFYRSLCEQAGYRGPLHRCTFFGNKAVGARLQAMMALGASRPWQDALQMLTGTREMDAAAIVAYFAPLKAWMDRENAASGEQCGW